MNESVRLRTHFSDFFGVSAATVEAYGAFNVSLINDLPLFIDPFLLFNSEKEACRQLHDGIIRYVTFLRDKAVDDSVDDGLLQAWFTFPEVKQNWLGYSRVGNAGSGLGLDFARSLLANLSVVFSNFGDEHVTKGSHLEKLCLIKDGVGRDNISDFTTNLIKHHLATFTETFALEHLDETQRRRVAIAMSMFNYTTETWETKTYELPFIHGDFVLLTPRDMLTKDDIWINKTDIVGNFADIASTISNQQLRSQINNYLARAIPKKAKKSQIDKAIASAILRYPEFIDHYIRWKEDHGDEAVSVSEQRVAESEEVYISRVREFVHTLNTETSFYEQLPTTYDEAMKRVQFLKDVIENKGGHRLFFYNGAPVRREQDIHILYRLTWWASPVDVTREANDGRGPVDFKVSRGAADKTLVEFKLASNTQLRRNLEKQAAIYEAASDAKRTVKVITYFSDAERSRVLGILDDLGLIDNPDVVLIDARPDKPSGSKA